MAYCAQTLAICLTCFCFSGFYSTRDTITTSRFLSDPETLVSSKAIFKFGFFSPVNSTSRYIGIWYNTKVDDKLEVVWVSNREARLNDSSGVLKVSEDCNLQFLDAHNRSMWLTNVAPENEVTDCVAQLLDTGNLVLYSNASGKVFWQSFDLPTDTFLPHMQATIDENYTGPLIACWSWESPSNPSYGRFSSGLNHRRPSEIFIWDGDRPYWRSGPWDGTMFLGIWGMYFSAKNDGYHIESDEEGTMNISFSSASKRVREHYVLNYDGTGLQKDWDDNKGDWYIFWQTLESECDVYGKCGEFGRCNKLNLPICSCLMGFQPINNREWSAGNWSSGCARRTPLQCQRSRGNEDGFLRLRNMKVPDNAMWLDSKDEDDCRRLCLRNCSCSAYAHKLGYGCMIWIDSLIDIQDFTVVGVDLFIRLAHSELGGDSLWKVIIVFVLIIGAAVLIVFYYFLWRCMKQKYGSKEQEMSQKSYSAARTSDIELQDFPLFKFEELVVATENFSESNKLGRGGFGSVYKGKLEDGQEIAVKRLSRASLQGLQEFMNEVVVISKLQHRNLVRLLGCCAEEDEKLLVYEYLPNKSLDALLFDPVHQERLHWECRFNIIKGISRGLLYLHRDSRLKIIHRDLKASNILLDHNLDPKISDFGMARIFRGNEDQGDTRRIVGTYGYMSPEYAMEGRFSEKSDVFSFGVLLLEIVSGRRNKSFIEEEGVSLLAHAWKLWDEDDSLSFVDSKISKSPFEEEILKCIQLGLLCVQEFPEDRPTISMVISMIDNEATDLPRPTRPGFTQRRTPGSHYTANGVSVSSLIGR